MDQIKPSFEAPNREVMPEVAPLKQATPQRIEPVAIQPLSPSVIAPVEPSRPVQAPSEKQVAPVYPVHEPVALQADPSESFDRMAQESDILSAANAITEELNNARET